MTSLADIQRHVGVPADGKIGPVTLAAIAKSLGMNASIIGKRMNTSARGIAMIHSFEGFAKKLPDGRVQAYPDPDTGGAPWTIGWGSTTDEAGKPIQPGTIWTKERADARFVQHLAQFEAQVNALLGGAPTTQGQFDALVSFAYNIGAGDGGLKTSTLLRKHKAGDYAGAKGQFARWNKAAGKVMSGLTRRRSAESELYAS